MFLIVSLFSHSAYQFFYSIASVAILPPYVFSGAYALKLALSGESYERAARRSATKMSSLDSLPLCMGCGWSTPPVSSTC